METNDWEYYESAGYVITYTENYFDYTENMTIYYDIDDPYEWTYSITYNSNIKII